MNPVKLVILCSVLALAGCGDKDDADTAKSEGSLLDQAKEMTSSAADSAKQTASDAGDAVGSAADNMQEGATSIAEQTGDAMDSGMAAAGDTVADTADATADAAGSAMDAGKEMAGDTVSAAEEAVGGGDATGVAAAGAGGAADETVAEAASAVTPAAGDAAATEADLAQGKTIYEGKCQACHATGAAGAPKMGDKANWAPRIAQGSDVLHQHAIEGFKGAIGYMPPKGGFTALTDDEVKAAVDYMVSQNQ